MPFYFAEIKDISERTITLSGAEHRHLSKVMRVRKGATVTVTDGAGMTYDCFVAKVGRQETELTIINVSRERGEPSRDVTMAVGMSTSGKFDIILQMCAEIGVNAFIPLLTEKSKVKLEDEARARRKLTRWRDVLRSAIKQCERSRIPEISPPVEFSAFVDEWRRSRKSGIIAHPAVSNTDSAPARETLTNSTDPLLILVGPESGFSEAEFSLALESGFLPLNLGRRTLRAETAAPALATLALLPAT